MSGLSSIASLYMEVAARELWGGQQGREIGQWGAVARLAVKRMRLRIKPKRLRV